jgi:phage terminase Nu1 subunit (DNA packaging protein)
MAEENIVDVHTLAEFWEVDIRTIQNYADPAKEAPPLPRESRGRYDFVKAMKWMYNRHKRQIEILETSGDDNLHKMRLQGQAVENKRREIGLRKDLSELVDKKMTTIVFTNLANIIKSGLGGLKHDLKRELDEVTDGVERNKIIDNNFRHLDEIITQIKPDKLLQDADQLIETAE